MTDDKRLKVSWIPSKGSTHSILQRTLPNGDPIGKPALVAHDGAYVTANLQFAQATCGKCGETFDLPVSEQRTPPFSHLCGDPHPWRIEPERTAPQSKQIRSPDSAHCPTTPGCGWPPGWPATTCDRSLTS